MRFRLNPVTISLLCVFAHNASAEADLPALSMDKTPVTMEEASQETSAFVDADQLVGKQENQIEATGNAILRKRGQSIRADRLLYFQDTQDLDAQGSVVLEQDGNTMSGPHLKFNLNTSIGTMEQPSYSLAENGARGGADMLHIQGKQHYTLDKATYTTCPADNQDWQLKMKGLEIDRERQIGTAHQAWVEFMGVPILYSPWMNFPLVKQRESGFLSPLIGSTSKGGSELTLPYYWNIAPNLDATIAPRLISKRGLMLNNEFRYLEANYGGELHLNVLPGDAIANSTRSLFELKHNQVLASGLNGYVNLTRVSDDAYFRDLGDAVNVTSQVNLLQESGVTYSAGWWNAFARVQRYQTLQDLVAPIYARLPQLTLNAQQNYSGANLAFAGEYVNFSHPTLPKPNGQRLVLNPSVSYPLVSAPAFYLTPKVGLHSTYYVMGANTTTALPYSSRTLPIVSVDSGATFERDLNLAGGSYIQTLEPRAYYVYIPYKDQALLPNFDSAQADFNFTQMFTENRFFGNDCVGDANQVTVALTSRLLEQENGMERLQMTLGERFSFSAPRVNLVTPAVSTSRSDILLAAAGNVTRAWTLDGEFGFDPNQSHMQLYNIAARYRPEAGKLLNLGYRFDRNNALRQIDISTQWPLTNRWHAVGRWNYSLQDSQILEAIAGLEYNQSCWTLRLVAQRFTVGTQQTNTGFFLQLELNELVRIGSDPLALLKSNVLGYTKLNDASADKPGTALR
jgi:LPS-assembly protein